MKKKMSNVLSLDEFKDIHYGERGTNKREDLERGYKNFKVGAMIHDARVGMCMTQEELAERGGLKP